jgi:hypothetical protein
MPVGTKQEFCGFNVIGSFIKAIKSMPDAPSVLYAGNSTDEFNFFIRTFVISLID